MASASSPVLQLLHNYTSGRLAELDKPEQEDNVVIMPALGYGCGTAWFNSSAEEKRLALIDALTSALDAGMRHIDEAEMYKNEVTTGEAIANWLSKTGTPRSELFITSKLISVDEGIETVCRRTLNALRVPYLDLYLIHAPFKRDGTPFDTPLRECWKQMESLVEKGLCRSVGVSNWHVHHLEEIYDTATIKPVCNQIEYHAYLQQPSLVQWCTQHKITVTGYGGLSPLRRLKNTGPLDDVIEKLAEQYGKSPAQILMRWSLQQGVGVLSTTSKPERLEEYKAIFSFALTQEDMKSISDAGNEKPQRLFWTRCPGFDANPPKESSL